MKKILITSSDAMMYQFLLKHSLILIHCGYSVDIAVFPADGYEGQNYPERIKNALPETSSFFVVHTARSPLSPKNFNGYRELKRIINNGDYDLVWTNEPVMGVLTRLASAKRRRSGMRVMYISHGFHFYKGAPLKNWLVFYPIEKLFAHFTDTIVTVNRDDYETARKKLPCGDIRYIHGIGFDTERFKGADTDRTAKREALGIPDGAFTVLSVGELNKNKNHSVVIDAMAELKSDDIYYVICGEGCLKSTLKEKARSLGLEKRVILTGFREDIAEICRAADVYCFPSVREGLGISLLEAMSCGLPVVCSAIRGIRDLIENGNGGFLCSPFAPSEFAAAINKLYSDRALCKMFGERNYAFTENYSCETAENEVKTIIKGFFN